MSQVTVFLRTSLFSLGGEDAHVPPGTMVLRGSLPGEQFSGTLRIDVSECLDVRGKPLTDKPVALVVPMSKVDHILLAGA